MWRKFSQRVKMSTTTISLFVLLLVIYSEAKSDHDQNNNLVNSIMSSGPLKSFETKLMRTIDAWDVNNPKYKLIGDWMTLIRTSINDGEQEEVNSPQGNKYDQHQPTSDQDSNNFLGRISRFLSTHRIDIKMPASYVSASRNFLEGRSSKLKRFIIPFVILMVLKKSIEIPIFLAVISLIAFKGLSAGLISLVLSGATAFKSFLEHHHPPSSKVSYEVVPQINHWSRSGGAGVDYPNFGEGSGYQYHTISNAGLK